MVFAIDLLDFLHILFVLALEILSDCAFSFFISGGPGKLVLSGIGIFVEFGIGG